MRALSASAPIPTLGTLGHADPCTSQSSTGTRPRPSYYNSTGGVWKPYRDGSFEDKHPQYPWHPAMITCESKKYEPAKALAVCDYLQKKLVAGGKLISPYKDAIHGA